MNELNQKHAPVIVPREHHTVSRKQFSPAVLDVLYRLQDAGYIAYIAGGGVRDLLVGRHPKDFDVATDARPEQVRRVFHRCRLIGRRFRLVHVFSRGETIEVSTFRANLADNEEKSRFHERNDDGQILRDNIYGTPEQDAWRRDFTINALFYNIQDFSIIDYVGGLKDIEAKLVRSIGDPESRFVEDPVRMIRAVRFASTLNFDIETGTAEAIRHNAERIALASPARMFEEMQKLFFCGNARDLLVRLDSYGLLKHMLPEIAEVMQSSEQDRAWLERVTRQLDTWRSHHVRVTPELLFALLFGLVHERKIQQLVQDGAPIYHAAEDAVASHLASLASRVLIPKAIGRHLSQIMAVQAHFLSQKKTRHERFMKRACFHDAFIYFKMRSRFEHKHADEVHYWDELIRAST